jgi:hypothetical protein
VRNKKAYLVARIKEMAMQEEATSSGKAAIKPTLEGMRTTAAKDRIVVFMANPTLVRAVATKVLGSQDRDDCTTVRKVLRAAANLPADDE